MISDLHRVSRAPPMRLRWNLGGATSNIGQAWILPRCSEPGPTRMATPISISIPHQLGRAEARRRIDAGFAKLVGQLPGVAGACSQRWEGDRLIFTVSGLGQGMSGVIDVREASVTMDLQLAGVLGMIASGLKGRIQQAGQLLLAKK
ncbi:MAG: polyhydroxyalkanoic acid system family protein [Burkholderiales bacterium]|nr:polyhydroxyalkanoic acid system family protein [Burkholderiales bacterium]